MPDEKDLRGITKGGKDLVECLNREESHEYYDQETKGKSGYSRHQKLKFESKREPNSEVRIWSKEEIKMYEEIKELETVTEMVLYLLKTQDEISAVSACQLLKDHPRKPGSRGVAQAIGRVYEKFEPVLQKRQKGRQVFYSFARDEYKKVSLKDLYAVYRGQMTWDDVKPRLEIPSSKTLLEYVQEFEPRVSYLEKILEILTNKEVLGQRVDVHHYIHFGTKEDQCQD